MSRAEIEAELASDFALTDLTKNANQINLSRNMPQPRPLINLTPNTQKAIKNTIYGVGGAFGFHEVAGGVKDLSAVVKNAAESYKDINNPEEVNIQLPEMPRKLGVTSLTPTPYNNVNKSTMPVNTAGTAAALAPTITSGSTTLPTAPVQDTTETEILPTFGTSQLPNY